jgi:hypothetical protein
MPGDICITYTSTPEDAYAFCLWVSANRPEHKRYREYMATWKAIAISIVALVVSWSQPSPAERWTAAILILAVGIAFVIYRYRSYPARMAASAIRIEQLQPSPAAYVQRRIRIGEDGVHVESAVASAHYTWAALTAHDLTSGFLLLWSGSHPVAAIPRHSMSAADIESAMGWCKERIAHVA